MPSTYSPSLKLELIGTGEQAGTWGTTTNYNLGTLLEQAITGVITITMNIAITRRINTTMATAITTIMTMMSKVSSSKPRVPLIRPNWKTFWAPWSTSMARACCATRVCCT